MKSERPLLPHADVEVGVVPFVGGTPCLVQATA